MREALGHPSQLRGEAIVRFILSEDENTAQVAKEVETHKDIVFLHVGLPKSFDHPFPTEDRQDDASLSLFQGDNMLRIGCKTRVCGVV